ncbi:ubiquitin carboxyl-terminal hydrolase 45 [Octopus bimaculoides]|nr:ubiquitin carboxyl-terminal hydrolase 45 [Octopus bimaculoides]
MVLLTHTVKSSSYNMGKKNRLKSHRESVVNGSESSEESFVGQGCPHVNKAVNFAAMKKSLLKEKFGICKDCPKKTENKKISDTPLAVNGDDYEGTLWVCLLCGNQGCDRNSTSKHALKHYENSHSCHFIVINTTSWTAWCYVCDDEVPVEKNKKIMECLDFLKKEAGISNLDSVQKDSSLQSLNDSKRNKTKTASKLTNSALNVRIKGISNLGNTCFLNAVLQVRNFFSGVAIFAAFNVTRHAGMDLFPSRSKLGKLKSVCVPWKTSQSSGVISKSIVHAPKLSSLASGSFLNYMQARISSLVWRMFTKERRSFRAEITSGIPANGPKNQPPIDIVITDAGPLTRSLLKFLHDMSNSSSNNSVIHPDILFGQICKKAPRFKGFQQQDSHELLHTLLDVMRTEEIEYCRQAKYTFIDRLFGGHLISTVSCGVCQHMSQIFEPFLDLSLPVIEEKPLRPNLSVGTKKKDSANGYSYETAPVVENVAKPMSKYAERKLKRQTKKEKRKMNKARNQLSQLSVEEKTEAEENESKCEQEKANNEEEENGEDEEEDEEEVENEKESQEKAEETRSNCKEDTSDADIEDNIDNEGNRLQNKENRSISKSKLNESSSSLKKDSEKDEESTLKESNSTNHVENSSVDSLQHPLETIDQNATYCTETENIENKISYETNRLASLELNGNVISRGSLDKDSSLNDMEEDSNKMASFDTFSSMEIANNTDSSIKPSFSDELEKGAIEASESVSKCFSTETLPEAPAKMVSIHEEIQCEGENNSHGLGHTLSSVATKSSMCVAQMLSNCSQGPPLAHPEEGDLDDIDDKEYVNMSSIKRQAQAKSMSTLTPRSRLTTRKCSILSSLHQFTSAELLTGNNKVRCKNCSQRKEKHSSSNKKEAIYTNASKQFLIFRPPAILTLHLKRFEQIGFSTRKVNRHVEFPFLLDIAPFCSSLSQYVKAGQKKVLYSLYGIVEHSGRLSGGHYTAYIKVCKNNLNKANNFVAQKRLNPKEYIMQYRESLLKGDSNISAETEEEEVDPESLVPTGKWYHISDTLVREVPESLVEKAQAYLLFYERIY